MVPLSAVLIAQNEESTIGDAIASVEFCDEIVLVGAGGQLLGDLVGQVSSEADHPGG